MKLSEKIIKIREENNLTQDEMAERIFVTRQAISKWERGISYPSLDVLRLISKEFKISMNNLLDVSENEKNKEYKPIGFKHYGFIVIYVVMLLIVGGAMAAFNILLEGTDTALWAIVFYNVLLGVVALSIVYMLVQSIFPNNAVLVEYNDFGIRIRTLKGTKEIPFQKITALEIRTHGNWTAGRLTVRTFDANYTVYPLKDLNQVKTVIDEVKVLNRY